ncbi:hypothetical protein QQZ08_010233 [Neonectria magnoliae]|uniref:CorA-like transporter domain-containing protein n=1 Tax=Neonectria magnoliae TaxID=2732573 RepID=A0ABR1HIK8_9HYPO
MPRQGAACSVLASKASQKFLDSCQNYASFPSNLVQNHRPRRVLESIGQTLNEQAEDVFDDDDFRLKFIDVYPQTNDIGLVTIIRTQQQLQNHVQKSPEDPLFTYVSMTSDSSRDPIKCSSAMFKLLCSHHQIPPSFMDSVFGFRGIDGKYDCGLAMFCDENTLLDRPEHILPLQVRGRSGREIRHSFLLRSVEKSKSLPDWSWGIRQLAVYHSFDVVNGRSIWITVKGNTVQEDWINDAVSENPAMKPDSLSSVPESFAASLEIHAMILDWCDENWRWFINEIETVSRKVTTKVRTVHVDDEPNVQVFKKHATIRAMDQSNRKLSIAKSIRSTLQNPLSFPRKQDPDPEMAVVKPPENDDPRPSYNLEEGLKKIDSLSDFRVREIQRLQEVMERIEEAHLTLGLNKRVIRQLREHYESMANEYHMPEMDNIQNRCRNDIMRFLSRARSVEENIETRRAQLQSLLSLVHEGKTLYDSIIQHRGIQVNKMYADIAQQSTLNMERIAHQTKRETSSMHIITFVTLIFLPGTFIASFFQSGIIQWPELDLGSKNWLLNKHAFILFSAICLPLMVVTFAVWLTVYIRMRRDQAIGSLTR